MILLLQLLLAHLIGDFILQPAEWIKAKEENKLKAWQLYVHVALHVGLLLALVGDIQFIGWALLLGGVGHLPFGISRSQFRKKSPGFPSSDGWRLIPNNNYLKQNNEKLQTYCGSYRLFWRFQIFPLHNITMITRSFTLIPDGVSVRLKSILL